MIKDNLKGRKAFLKDPTKTPKYGWVDSWDKKGKYEIIDDTYTSGSHEYYVYIKNNRDTWGVLFTELVIESKFIQEELEV